MTDLDAQRSAVRSLLAPSAPEDALTAYYALYHDPRRTQLTLYRASAGEVKGFVAVCQTGHDLFRPLVVVRTLREGLLEELFRQSLDPNRPYYLIAPLDLSAILEPFLDMQQPTVNRIYRIDPDRFQLNRSVEINVLVQEQRGPDGYPRWEIRSGGQVAAVAGTNWRSPFCAEIYVQTEVGFQGRGWGRAVVRAATLGLLREGLLPLYMVQEAHLRSIRLAEAVGYADTGHRELAAEVRLSCGNSLAGELVS